MAQIPQTRKKLGEAQFFLRHLLEMQREFGLNSEGFGFYLSALLCAGRSVTLFLQVEQKELYDGWCPDWENQLNENDRELLRFMNKQRVAEVHLGGAQVQTVFEFVPVTEIRTGNLGDPVYGIHWFGPPSTPPPQIGKSVHFFEMGGTPVEVVGTCRRYVELLERLVREFDQKFPS